MIKRRFYRLERGDGDDASSSDFSSSDSEVEVEAQVADSSDEDTPPKEDQLEASVSSGYESEESSGNQIDADSSGFIDGDNETGNGRKNHIIPKSVMAGKESIAADVPDCILKCKSVYKCRICPRVICLSEESLRTHLNSKRHCRSEKLLKENKLKEVLNSDGEIENQETAAEMNARIIALAQEKPKKNNKGRQRQRKRSRKQNDVDASKNDVDASKNDVDASKNEKAAAPSRGPSKNDKAVAPSRGPSKKRHKSKK